MTLDATVYVLTAEGIGIAGVVGVFPTENEARMAAEEVMPLTDGYHALVMRPMKLGRLYHDQFPYGLGRHDYMNDRMDGVEVAAALK